MKHKPLVKGVPRITIQQERLPTVIMDAYFPPDVVYRVDLLCEDGFLRHCCFSTTVEKSKDPEFVQQEIDKSMMLINNLTEKAMSH